MLKIFKYPLERKRNQLIEMPVDSVPLSLGVQRQSPDDNVGEIVLWALIDPEMETRKYEVHVFATGQKLESNIGEYVGTIQDFINFVWHIFIR